MKLWGSTQSQGVGQKFSIFVAVIATLFYFTTSVYQQLRRQQEARHSEERTATMIDELTRERRSLDDAKNQNQELLAQITKSIKAAPSTSQAQKDILLLRQGLNDVHSELSQMQASLGTINNALNTNPEKALTLPLMRKDVDDFKVETQRDIDSLRSEMARSYDLNKWLIGLILAAVLGTTISSFMQSRKPPAQSARFE